MFEKYNEETRRVIFFARLAASTFGGQEITREHLLYALVKSDGFKATIESKLSDQFMLSGYPKAPLTTDLPIAQGLKDILADIQPDPLDPFANVTSWNMFLAICRSYAAESKAATK